MGIIKTGGAWCGDYWTVVDGVEIVEMGGGWCRDYWGEGCIVWGIIGLWWMAWEFVEVRRK